MNAAKHSIFTVGLVLLVRLYQVTLSPFVGGQCRYMPTCSQYSIEALRRHGAWRGTLLTLRRLGRCHPWAKQFGYDPVPLSPAGPIPQSAERSHNHG